MNCDQAFDVLTGPRRASDRELLVHLSGCPRCCEMQATLEPALGLFRADSAAMTCRSPWEVASEGSEVATQAALKLTTSAAPPRRGLHSLWGYAAAVVLGAGLVWSTFALNSPAVLAPTARGSAQDCLYLTDSRPAGMTGREMTQSCLACHAVTEGP